MKSSCPKCGESVDDVWAACPYCATSLRGTTVCSECGAELKSGWKACPHCGCLAGSRDVPDLPDYDEFEKAKEPTPAQKERAQKLLDELRQAVAAYTRECQAGPSAGEMIGFLFGKKTERSPYLDKALDLRDKISDTVDSVDLHAGPWFEVLTNKEKKNAVINRENGMVELWRDEIRYIERQLGLSVGGEEPRKSSDDRFICPGCGEKATAKNAKLCPECNQFVHNACKIGSSEAVVFGFGYWLCPVCRSRLPN